MKDETRLWLQYADEFRGTVYLIRDRSFVPGTRSDPFGLPEHVPDVLFH
jgi:hypothetical protein